MNYRKLSIFVSLFSAFIQTPVFANCDKNLEQCAIVGGSAVVATGSGIYALTKYRNAKNFDLANTQVIMDVIQKPQTLDSFRVNSLASQVSEGDRIKIAYRLSEANNRTHHVGVLESEAESALNEAADYRAQARQALMPRSETITEVVNGQTRTRVITRGPDFIESMRYDQLADDSMKEGKFLLREAALVKSGGGQVPWYDFDKEIADAAGTRNTMSEFLNKHSAEGGTVLKVTRLEAQKLSQLKKIIWKARGGVAGTVAMGAFAAEEAIAGVVSKSLAKKANSARAFGSK